MLVNKLHVKNLGPIKEATLPAAPVTLLMGPNEKGKTTLMRALYTLRFGTIPGLEVKENAALVREGSDDGWMIQADLDGLELKATRSSRPPADTFDKVLGDARVFRALSDCQEFFDLTTTARRELIADLVANDTSSLAELLESEGGDPRVVAKVRAGEMKAAHGLAEEHRRAADRLLDDLKARANAPVDDPEVETKGGAKKVSTIPLDVVQQGMERLTANRDAALKAAASRVQYESAEKDAERARAELEELTAEASWTDADEGAFMALQRDIDQARLNVQKHLATKDSRRKDAEALKALLAAGGACPTCKTKLEGAVAAAVRETQRNLEGEALKAGELQTSNAATLKELEEKRRGMMERREQATKLSTVRARLQERVDRAEKMQAPPAAKPGATAEDLAKELERLGKIRDARRAYDTAVELRGRAQDQIQERLVRRDQLKRWEDLVKPGQVAGEEEVLQEVNAYIEEAAAAMFPGEKGAVLLTPGYEVLVHHRKLALASRSATMRAGFACSVALSRLSKLGLLFLDNLEAVDDTNRRGVLGVLKAGVDAGWLRNAYIAAVKQDPKPSAKVPWLAWVKVDNGTATVME